MPPRKPPASKLQPTRVVGDLNAPQLVVKFQGLFAELTGVGENITVAMMSKYQAMLSRTDTTNAEVQELFLEAFLPSNPDLEAKDYPFVLQWQAIHQLFMFRLAQIEVTSEVIRNQPLQLNRRASSG